jgi:ubiquinone/menaquinone biosynthesis C-methylase UbiE
MGFHTFDPDRADKLEDVSRYRWCSNEELFTYLAPSPDDEVADLGSGTGFYTDFVADHVETVYAVDVQSEMHERYAENGIPNNVETVTAPIDELPLDDDALDSAFTTMTYHEFSGPAAIAEIGRVLRPGGRLVVIDWAREGYGTDGPPLESRHDLGHAISALSEGGFVVDRAESRTETFVCVARNESDRR